jgi:hypothetical protein
MSFAHTRTAAPSSSVASKFNERIAVVPAGLWTDGQATAVTIKLLSTSRNASSLIGFVV